MSRAMLGVLVPPLGPDAAPPEALPLGRAALRVAGEGIDVLFGDRAEQGVLFGVRAVTGGWEPARSAVDAVYDRYPSVGRPGEHRRLLAALAGVPLANDPDCVALCRDKLATQRALGSAVPMPEVEADPARFPERLARWERGFLKPRWGSFGRGVRRVGLADPLDDVIDGEPAILQRALRPPPGWAGACARVLVQRDVDGAWRAEPPVLRRSRVDPVVNAARGSEVALLDAALPGHADAIAELGVRAAAALTASPLCVELGVDVVLDERHRAWVIEVNGTPRGRLERLAADDPAWLDAHVEACARPLRYLARLRRP